MIRIAVILLALFLSHEACADIYKFTENGHTYYGNKPYSSSSTTYRKAKTKINSVRKTAYFYKYLDPNGGYIYTDEPKGNYRLLSKTKVDVYYPPNNQQTDFHTFSGSPVYSNSRYKSVNKSRFSDLIAETAGRYQVDEKLLHAVIQTESAYNSNAVSRAGAVGLMQLMPGTAQRYGVVDRNDPAQNVEGGTRYLRDLLDMFSPNIDLAIAAYNAGENAVLKYHYSIPPYSETRNYVKQVLALYNN